jgi:2-phospho-L-lactate transferase/gluconeogenesis factor (CofD/UPF0052 family)
MAIQATPVGTTNTTLLTASGNTAMTFLSFCNHSSSTVKVSIHIVPSIASPNDNNILIKELEIVAGDTYVAYQGSEKIILGDADYVSAVCDTATSVTALVSYLNI